MLTTWRSLRFPIYVAALAATTGCSGGGSNALPGGPAASTITSGGLPGTSTSSLAAPVMAGATSVAAPTTIRIGGTTRQDTPPAGTSLFFDDFENKAVGQVDTALTTISGSFSTCQPPGASHEYCATTKGWNIATAGNTGWTDYTFDAYTVMGDPNTGKLGAGGAAILGRVQDASHFYQLELRDDWSGSGPKWYIWKATTSAWSLLASGPVHTSNIPYYHLRLAFSGNTMKAYIAYNYGSDFQYLGAATDGSYPSGAIGLRSWGTSKVRFDVLRVTGSAGSAVTTGPRPGASADPGTPVQTAPPTVTPNLPSETAHSATRFLNSAGIVMHNSYSATAYNSNVPLIEQLVEGLGVRLVRDGINPYQPNVCAEDSALAAHGIKFVYAMRIDNPLSDIDKWMRCVGGPSTALAFEGPNEYDLGHPRGDDNWPNELRAFQRNLYAFTKQNYPSVAVVAPSVTSGDNARAVGDISQWADYGNSHIYFTARAPGNTGYGNNGYGSIPYLLNLYRPMTPSKPIAVTETGYGTGQQYGQNSETVQARYVPRMYLEYAMLNAPVVAEYEFIDGGDSGGFAHMGLLRSDLSAKPAYNALKSLLGVVADSGTATDGSIAVALAGQTQNVKHIVFKKSDGSYALALWIETASQDPTSPSTPTVNVQQTVTLQFARSITPTLYSYDSSFNFKSSQLSTGSSITLPVQDQVEVLTFN